MGVPLAIEEDDKGLYVLAQVSRTRENADRLQLMKDGVVDRLSIGEEVAKADFGEVDGKPVRILREVKLFEVSPVTFAANEDAVILRVKALLGLTAPERKATPPFADLPLAERDRPWDADAAVQRVRRWAGGPDNETIDWREYRMAFSGTTRSHRTISRPTSSRSRT